MIQSSKDQENLLNTQEEFFFFPISSMHMHTSCFNPSPLPFSSNDICCRPHFLMSTFKSLLFFLLWSSLPRKEGYFTSSETSLRVHCTLNMQNYGRKVQCVQQDLQYGNFDNHSMLKIQYSKFLCHSLMMLNPQRCFTDTAVISTPRALIYLSMWIECEVHSLGENSLCHTPHSNFIKKRCNSRCPNKF
jgi:hypothetical protein